MYIQGFRLLACVFAALLFLAGCQSDFTLSSAVRTGDTVTVSLGDADPTGSDSNLTLGTNIVRDTDISATITDQSTATFDISVKQVFRVLPDPTANQGVVRNRSQWMAVIDLIDPNSSSGQAPSLAVGDAVITLLSAKFKQPHVINTKILPGDGTPHGFVGQNEANYGAGGLGLNKLGFITPALQALVSVDGTLPAGIKLAGAEYRFAIPNVDVSDINSLTGMSEAALPAKLPTAKQISFEYQKTEQISQVGTDILIVITTPEGLEQSELSAFNFVMTTEQAAINNNLQYWNQHFVSAEFYDTQGQAIGDLSALVGSTE